MGLLHSCVANLIEVNVWFGYREKEWGLLRVVGMESVGTVWWDGVSPILGMFVVRARWWLWLVSEVVMVASMG